jgi:hypothetical protein
MCCALHRLARCTSHGAVCNNYEKQGVCRAESLHSFGEFGTLVFSERAILSAAAEGKPQQSGDQICQINKRQLAVWPFRHGI